MAPITTGIAAAGGSHSQAAAAAQRTLVTACVGVLLALLNFTLPLTTLPVLAVSLNASASDQTWILSGISLSVAALLLASGSLADDHGRKRVFLVGLALFVVASGVCALAPNALTFIVGRVLQGAGTAAILSSSLGLLAHVFPSGGARTHATGLWSAMIGAGVALGPLVGALFAAWWWRGAYIAVAILSALTLVRAVRTLEESRAGSSRRVDWAGVATLGGGLAATLAGLIQGNHEGWVSTPTIALLCSGVALLIIFTLVEARSGEPMIDLRLLTHRGFVAATLASGCTGAAIIGTMTYIPTSIQRALDIGSAGAALVLLSWSVAAFAVSLQARRIAGRLSPRAQLTLGLLLVAVGLAALLGITVDSSWLRLVPGFIISGIGAGLLNAGLARAAVDTVPPARASMGSGANNMARYVGNGIGVAVLVAAITARAHERAHELIGAIPGLHDRAGELAVPVATGHLPVALGQVPPEHHQALARIAARAALDGMSVGIALAVALSLLGAAATFLLLRSEPIAPAEEVQPSQGVSSVNGPGAMLR